MMQHQNKNAGYSLVELIVVAALVTLIFGGLFASIQAMIGVISGSKAKAGAVALANERMEYVRSLSYNQVGTVGAPPYGNIPQTRTVVLNGVSYTENVLVRNVDDSADGTGYSGDSNGIIEDYKLVEVTYSWFGREATSTLVLSARIVPAGIETGAGGGSLRVNVFDANINPVSNASVTIVNDTLATTTNTTQYTNVNGELLLSGLPTGADYSIWTTRSGYSADGTYEASSTNPNPTTQPIAISEGAVSTMNFQIDLLSDLTITTEAAPVMQSFSDDFSTATYVDSFVNTAHATDKIELADNSGYYYLQGTTTSTTTDPSVIDSWYAFDFESVTSAPTSLRVFLYYDDGSGLAIVPEASLPGNTAGFTGGPVDLRGLDVSTFHTLALVAELTTTDQNFTPELSSWELSYIESQGAISGIPVYIKGNKVIGTDDGGLPVFKFNRNYTTDSSGEVELTDIEYDMYSIQLSSAYDILEVCPSLPHVLFPDVSDTVAFTLGSLSGSFLHVTIVDPSENIIPGATVRLQNTGYDETQTASLCGQTYFNGGGLYDDTAYTLTVSSGGYSTEVVPNVTINETASTTVTLSPS